MSVHAATRNHTVHFQSSMEAKCAIAELLDQSATNLALIVVKVPSLSET